ncbi:hypothetical protein GJR96_03255 [Haloferax sp. MBLA0076]|uniref:Integral membrane protein n=1 Tax=Haloferax litoreum TaxID=2666140 RepID=A0A6A8GDT0_9EURY|nr:MULTISPECIES: hypothetical protein [Haloferax]KAB1192505.1 hypothetical protein Hfx1148_03250 [Haloferax sp. CBA1148]MRX20976.1 hypothetical protein [Haloferax litoreum]
MAAPTDRPELTRLHYLGIVLAAITGVIHLVLGAGALASNLADPLGLAFVGAAAGFAGGIVAVLRGDRQTRSRAILFGIPFTAGQIVLYVAFNWPDVFGVGGVVDKIAQIALVAVLVVLYRRES